MDREIQHFLYQNPNKILIQYVTPSFTIPNRMLEIGNRNAKRAAAIYQQRKRILYEPVNASRVKRFRRATKIIGRSISEKAKGSYMLAKLPSLLTRV
ncbi:hypothetical protein CUC08_Gglean003068 [Alternaria sp. MG1]|jgi:hypothetical protein|uniref:Uncharacterized protein n=1 Tax=Alternaria tenuissima TaxID=119927 RepID=A0A4Q4MPS7_9PLEO|nr:hypothetical protein IG631_18619 [Alternaria alternata]RII16628.1 hypothetical protein CUC08_Gglean003068 [Alternaria sp. MG1]RYN54627.1 hypothetical protein AA0114_g3929 [Alternaria tenuissima]